MIESNTENAIKKVVIVGGGTAGWMAAATLSKTVGSVLDITLVESSLIGTVGVGEATIPPLISINQIMGIDERDFMKTVRGTFKLGIAFENWTDLDHRYIHSFGITGKDHWSAGFQHFWLRSMQEGDQSDFGDYCLEVEAAEKIKFAHLPEQKLNYAYHIDSFAYAALMRERAEKMGVKRIDDKVVNVALHAETGDITHIDLASGQTLEGDLFIDCTGFRALLIEQTLRSGYHDWTHLLPCDRAIAVQSESSEDVLPYTRSIAHTCGWQWRIPLQHRRGNGIVYCSSYMDDDEAEDLLLSTIDGKPLSEPNRIKFRTGMRRKHWNKNCIAIGLSDGFIEPLESTSIHLIQRAIIRLTQLFPLHGIDQSHIDEYNTQTDEEYDHIRDFIILHYHVTNRDDTEFWRMCRDMDIPDSLRHRIELFRETGCVFRKEGELFAENSWTQVMLGQGITPKRYNPIADEMKASEFKQFMEHVKTSVRNQTDKLPTHMDYVKRYCNTEA